MSIKYIIRGYTVRIIVSYMDLNARDEPIDDAKREIALIFYVENSTV